MHESDDRRPGRGRGDEERGLTAGARGADRPTGLRRQAGTAPVLRVEEPTGVLAALVRHWPVSVALVLIGAAAGCGWAWRVPDVHTAETRLSVGSQELSAQAVPGYAFAVQTLTSNYARYVRTTDAVRDDLASSLGSSASTLVGVTASPIPESNILRIEVESTDADVAERAADQVGAGLIASVADSSANIEALREELNTASAAAAAAEQAELSAQRALDVLLEEANVDQVAVDAARQAVVEAATAAAVSSVEQEALSNRYRTAREDSGASTTLGVIRPAEITRDDGASSLQTFGVLGALVGGAAAVLAALLRDAGRKRRRPGTVSLVGAGPDRSRVDVEATTQMAGRR